MTSRDVSPAGTTRVNTALHELFVALFLILGPSTLALAQSSIQRDQEALTIIAKSVIASGGQELLASIQDVTATGTVTYGSANQPTGTVTVKGRGLSELKIEANLPTGVRTVVATAGGGSLTDTNGEIRPILRQSANDLGGFTLPYLPLFAAVQSTSTSITYVGLVTHDGVSEYDIRVQNVYTVQQDATGNLGVREAHDFYIDPKTYLIAAISDLVHFGGPNDQGVPHEVLFSNYQAENGIMVPLNIEESVRGTTGMTMTFTQVTFNSGLTDSTFSW